MLLAGDRFYLGKDPCFLQKIASLSGKRLQSKNVNEVRKRIVTSGEMIWVAGEAEATWK
jgi:hypothetical protein